jgi:hypothetical protein
VSTAYWVLIVVAVVAILAGLVTHVVGPIAGTSSRGFISLADACLLLAIALAVGRLLPSPAAKPQE